MLSGFLFFLFQSQIAFCKKKARLTLWFKVREREREKLSPVKNKPNCKIFDKHTV